MPCKWPGEMDALLYIILCVGRLLSWCVPPCRYIVIPARPAGTEGWTEEQLMQLVTRDSMIGVAPALRPDQVPAA